MLKGLFKAILLLIALGMFSAVLVPKYFATADKAPVANAPEPLKTVPPMAVTPSMRQEYSDRLERNYLDKGMDVYVRLNGKFKDSISIKYVLLSRPAVYKIQKDGKLLDEMRQLGFKKAVFIDGMDTTYTFNLAE